MHPKISQPAINRPGFRSAPSPRVNPTPGTLLLLSLRKIAFKASQERSGVRTGSNSFFRAAVSWLPGRVLFAVSSAQCTRVTLDGERPPRAARGLRHALANAGTTKRIGGPRLINSWCLGVGRGLMWFCTLLWMTSIIRITVPGVLKSVWCGQWWAFTRR